MALPKTETKIAGIQIENSKMQIEQQSLALSAH
jgi:hypothetical protein